MAFALYDYLDARYVNVIESWWKNLEVKERAKLRSRIDMLEKVGEDIRPQILAGTTVPGIDKLRVHGSVQLRVFLCAGPRDRNSEFTFLIGATERDMTLVPRDAAEQANDRKSVVGNDARRRIKHVKVSGKRSDRRNA